MTYDGDYPEPGDCPLCRRRLRERQDWRDCEQCGARTCVGCWGGLAGRICVTCANEPDETEASLRALVDLVVQHGDTHAIARIKQSPVFHRACRTVGVEPPRSRSCECCRNPQEERVDDED